jgi:hypothetical protein
MFLRSDRSRGKSYCVPHGLRGDGDIPLAIGYGLSRRSYKTRSQRVGIIELLFSYSLGEV